MKTLQSEIKAALYRPTFDTPYAVKKEDRKSQKDYSRLGDLFIEVHHHTSPAFLDECRPGQFAVVDMEYQMKGRFEWPAGDKPAGYITKLIESHFDAPALRMSQTLWIV